MLRNTVGFRRVMHVAERQAASAFSSATVMAGHGAYVEPPENETSTVLPRHYRYDGNYEYDGPVPEEIETSYHPWEGWGPDFDERINPYEALGTFIAAFAGFGLLWQLCKLTPDHPAGPRQLDAETLQQTYQHERLDTTLTRKK